MYLLVIKYKLRVRCYMDDLTNKDKWTEDFNKLKINGWKAEEIATHYNIKVNSVRYYQHKNKYQDNRKLNSAQYNKKFREIAKEKMKESRAMFDSKCSICGFNKIQSALEFHHLDPKTKKYTISRLIKSGNKDKELKEELNKCILVCANCHAGIHTGEVILPF